MSGFDRKEPLAKYALGSILCDYFERTKKIDIDILIARWASCPATKRPEFIRKILSKLKISSSAKGSDLFQKIDTFLSAVGVRGHFEHQLEVFFLGLHIIKVLSQNITGETRDKLGLKSEKSIMYAWFETAIGHDYGYALQKAETIINELYTIYEHYGFRSICSSLEAIKKKKFDITEELASKNQQFSTATPEGVLASPNINGYIRNAISSSINLPKGLNVDSEIDYLMSFLSGKADKEGVNITPHPINHGLASALTYFYTKIESICAGEKSLNFAEWTKLISLEEYNKIESIAGAMALHNIKASGRTINPPSLLSFNDNFLAYVLFITDNIQDWNRNPGFGDDLPNYRLIGFSADSKSINMQIQLHHDEWPSGVVKGSIKYLENCSRIINLPSGASSNVSLNIVYHGIPNNEKVLISRASL